MTNYDNFEARTKRKMKVKMKVKMKTKTKVVSGEALRFIDVRCET